MPIKGKQVFGMRVSLLRQIVMLVRAIVYQVLLHFNKDGIDIRMVDGSHVAMVSLHVMKESMSQYAPSDDMVVDFDNLKTLLADAKDEETVELYVKEGNIQAPIFKVGGMTRTMGYVDPKEVSQPKVPELSHQAVISIDLNSIRRGLKNMETFTDHVAIECDPKEVLFVGKGESDVLEVVPEFKIMEAPKKKISSQYPLDYLMEMIKHLGKDVTISFSNDYPMLMTAKLEDSQESVVELGAVSYLLAPKIENV